MRSAQSVPGLDTPLGLTLAVGSLVAGTAVLYAVDLFATSGGLVWVPFHAALVGFVSAAVVGYRGQRLAIGVIIAYAPFLGFRLEWALLGLSTRPFVDRVAYFVRPDGLAALGVEAVVVGAVGYAGGRVVRRAAVDIRGSTAAE